MRRRRRARSEQQDGRLAVHLDRAGGLQIRLQPLGAGRLREPVVALHRRQHPQRRDRAAAAPGGEGGVVLRDQPAVTEGRDAGGRRHRRPVVEAQRPDVVHEDPHRPTVPSGRRLHASRASRATAARRTAAPMGLYSDHLRPRLHTFALNDRLTGEVRDRVCAGLTGDVLEIGYGSGLNQPHLPPSVARRVGGRAVGDGAAAERGAAVGLAACRWSSPGTTPRSSPFPDDRFDAALCTWVLCGIPDPRAALAEVARVLKPGATLHFVEHGLAPEPGVVRWQRRGNRINRAIFGLHPRQRRPRPAGRFAPHRHGAGHLLREGRTQARRPTCTRGAPPPDEPPGLTPPGGTPARSPSG